MTLETFWTVSKYGKITPLLRLGPVDRGVQTFLSGLKCLLLPTYVLGNSFCVRKLVVLRFPSKYSGLSDFGDILDSFKIWQNPSSFATGSCGPRSANFPVGTKMLAFAYIRPWEQFLCALVGGVAFSIKILGFK